MSNFLIFFCCEPVLYESSYYFPYYRGFVDSIFNIPIWYDDIWDRIPANYSVSPWQYTRSGLILWMDTLIEVQWKPIKSIKKWSNRFSKNVLKNKTGSPIRSEVFYNITPYVISGLSFSVFFQFHIKDKQQRINLIKRHNRAKKVDMKPCVDFSTGTSFFILDAINPR